MLFVEQGSPTARHARRMASPRLGIGRYSETGAFYLVTSIVADRKPLFADPRLAGAVAGEFCDANRAGSTHTVAWVVMPDHVHWLFQLRADALDVAVRSFKSRSARGVNRVAGRTGSVWQAGFHDHRIRDLGGLERCASYIVENPLRRRLASRLGDYPFWYCEGFA